MALLGRSQYEISWLLMLKTFQVINFMLRFLIWKRTWRKIMKFTQVTNSTSNCCQETIGKSLDAGSKRRRLCIVSTCLDLCDANLKQVVFWPLANSAGDFHRAAIFSQRSFNAQWSQFFRGYLNKTCKWILKKCI